MDPVDNLYPGCCVVYPFLSSSKVLAYDMQEGLFVFETDFTMGSNEFTSKIFDFNLCPNPINSLARTKTNINELIAKYHVFDVCGRIVKDGILNELETIREEIIGFELFIR